MARICKDALGLIGNTPLVLLERLHPGPGKIYAKVEFVNPGGSFKDRVALTIIEKAYKEKKLKPGQLVVEMTSGNMGSGIAAVCNIYGNPFTAVMSSGNSIERVKMIEALGAEVVLVRQVDGEPGRVTGKDLDAVRDKTLEIVEDKRAFFVDQFNNPDGPVSHEENTAPEIWEALGNQINAFTSVVGTGAIFVGCSRYLKKMNPTISCIAVEPEGAEVLKGSPLIRPQHLLQGTGYGRIPPFWDESLVDDYVSISDDEALHYCKLLAIKESLYVGFSSAANVCAAVKYLKSGKLGQDATVVTILCDTGLKY